MTQFIWNKLLFLFCFGFTGFFFPLNKINNVYQIKKKFFFENTAKKLSCQANNIGEEEKAGKRRNLSSPFSLSIIIEYVVEVEKKK